MNVLNLASNQRSWSSATFAFMEVLPWDPALGLEAMHVFQVVQRSQRIQIMKDMNDYDVIMMWLWVSGCLCYMDKDNVSTPSLWKPSTILLGTDTASSLSTPHDEFSMFWHLCHCMIASLGYLSDLLKSLGTHESQEGTRNRKKKEAYYGIFFA